MAALACGSRSGLNDVVTSLARGGASGNASNFGGSAGTDTAQLGGTVSRSSSASNTGGVNHSDGGRANIVTGGWISANTGGEGSIDRDAGPRNWGRAPLFCPAFSNAGYPYEASIWSDARGIFVLWIDQGAPAKMLDQARTIYSNSGDGWSEVFGSNASANATLNGFANGPLIQYGDTSPCGITFIENGLATCSAATLAVYDVFTVNRSLAYAVYGNRVLKYDGIYWTQWGQPLGSNNNVTSAVWASSDLVLVAGGYWEDTFVPSVYLFPNADPNTPLLQSGLPTSYISSAWGFGSNDLWLGNGAGQLLHYDGTSWSVTWSGTGDCNGIRHLWGAQGTLYFTTESSIRMWRNGEATVLAEYPCNGNMRVQSLWGNSASEVFFALSDDSLNASACGPVKILWFNGSELKPI